MSVLILCLLQVLVALLVVGVVIAASKPAPSRHTHQEAPLGGNYNYDDHSQDYVVVAEPEIEQTRNGR